MHLGLIKLAVPYPTSTPVTHMLSLSFVGPSLYSNQLGDSVRRLGLDREAKHTTQGLLDAGLVEKDQGRANMMWCKKTKRVMRVVFDHAYVASHLASHQASVGPNPL